MRLVGREALLAGVVSAGLMVGGGAEAADFGGNCCADLEERIAELEATTARKGNRKVSLSISGWVGQQLMYFDNGAQDNLYVTDIGSTLNSHVKFTGSAQITADTMAGYVLHMEVVTADPITAGNSAWGGNAPSALVIANSDSLARNNVQALYSYWFVKNNNLGQVMVGQIPQASQHAAVLVDGSGSLVPANWTPINGLGIGLARNGTELLAPNPGLGLTGLAVPVGAAMWCGSSSLPSAGNCGPFPINGVRYDTPTFAGFSASASWGSDDFWDVALRYAGEFGGFKVAAAAAYYHNSDEGMYTGFNTVVGLSDPLKRDAGYFQAGAYVQHVGSGLFLYGSYGKEYNDNILDDANAFKLGIAGPMTAEQPDGHAWYLKAGVRQNWTSLGATVLYGEYGERNDMFHPDLIALGFDGSKLTEWGLGVVQEIDAAAMSLWLTYRNYDTSFSGPGVAAVGFDNLDDINVVMGGGMISF